MISSLISEKDREKRPFRQEQSRLFSSPMLVVVAAFAIDLLAGEPPNRWHPVVWMGNLIGRLRGLFASEGEMRQLADGAMIAWGGAALVWGVVAMAERILRRLPRPVGFLLEAAVLKSTFSLGGLLRAAEDVEEALYADDLPAARKWVGWHLVSRDTSTLDESQLTAATIQSLAENLSDGVVAPLFYYRLGGLPAALTYRYLNTCDSMLGYRDEAREWLGKVSARTDDMLNLLPARLTAVGILAAGWGLGDSGAEAVAIYQRDAATTESPNAGHPMSAMAGVLGVELEKTGHYQLGKGQRVPRREDIQRTKRVLLGATVVCLGGIYAIWQNGRS
ncbi:MAG: adenosylcobinamide-phosphate synthase CbiB [Chloroflexota bacterium]